MNKLPGKVFFFNRMSLKNKLALLSIIVIVPLTVLTFFILYSLNQMGESYDAIVQNITRANEYNTIFKEDMDAVVYQMVARSLDKFEVETELGMKNPDRMITDAETSFENLKQVSTSSEAVNRLKSAIKLLITLRKRMNDINSTVKISGHYDENMVRLDTDIRIITDLIQDRITEYIYYEAENMETLRLKMEDYRRFLNRITIILSVSILLLVVIFSVVITKSITSPVATLVKMTGKVANGDFTARAVIADRENEMALLSDSFNNMVEQIGILVEDIKREQKISRNLELKLLQAQINPHFLYNTLDNILWLSEDGQKEQVASIVTALSQFFRTTLSGGRDFIRISEEISHIDAYLSIQKFRYSDILSYEIDIPEKYHDYLIIKMTLQPLVENALYHGIKNKRGRGMIKIGIREAGEDLCLFVEDDGMGMDPPTLEKLKGILEGSISPGEDNTGFGLANVAQRLRLNYGEAYGLKIDSVYKEGTRIEVLIPRSTDNTDKNFNLLDKKS